VKKAVVSTSRHRLLAGVAVVFVGAMTVQTRAQQALPEIVVQPQLPAPPRPTASNAPTTRPANDLASENTSLDVERDSLSPRFGASSFDMNRAFIETLPQGTDAPINSVLLQAPGVAQDSAVNGDIHVRNEHANVQYRINGVTLPDGISGFGHVLDTNFVGSLAVITGALPAQFGFHTSGVVDIQTKSGKSLQQGGDVGIYGGSFDTLTPTFDYGGRIGKTEYFVSGRGFTSNLGIENPTDSYKAIHDRTYQGDFFSYTSTLIDPQTRISTIFGNTTNRFQIPNNPGQPPAFTAFGVSDFDSSALNEKQAEQNTFGVLALQKSIGALDYQLAAFSRYSTLHFIPDTIGDLVFNGVASDAYRRSFANGLQGDGSYKLNEAHTLRAGFSVTGESTKIGNDSTVLPLDALGNPVDAPFIISDNNSKLGWLAGIYVQDEWKITDQLTVNAGVRFDQMWQYVDANQVSPRFNVVYKPFTGTTLHAGYARYFTPPEQALAGPVNVNAFNNTTAPAPCAAGPGCTDPLLPERSHYFDAGIVQQVTPQLTVGLDAYYKIARDLLDDGQFGAALILDGFNYEKAYNKGVELSATYKDGNFTAYGNLAWAVQKASNIVSNQYLIDPNDLAYISNNYIYTDHAQTLTGSAGASYSWNGTRFSASMIYGSGLRADLVLPDGSTVPNGAHVAPYATANIGISHEFAITGEKPITVRFDVVNVFDTVYQIRDGSGIGVFAPQYGERRGFFVGISKKL